MSILSAVFQQCFRHPLLRAAVIPVACLLFALAPGTAGAADILAADRVSAPEPLLPYLSWLPDPQGEIGIRTLASGNVQERFTPLYSGIPLKNKGPVWFRLVMVNSRQVAPAPMQAGGRLNMNLGQLPPGGARIFYSESPGPVSAPGAWHSETVNSREDALLPEAGLSPVSIYIRMEEMPGLWFSPVVGPQSATRSSLLPFDLLLPGIAAAAAVACLLRLIADRSQWTLWAVLYLVCILGQSSLPLPSSDKGLTPEYLPALLAPGLALMILPHVGRCMFRPDKSSVLKDGSLHFCSLLGAATAMLPLVPGFSWLTRLFPLWPLLLTPALPFCLSSMAAKKPGALAFSGAVIMPILGSVVCLAALKYPDLHPAAAQGSLWGLAVGGLGLVLARIPRNSSGPGAGDEEGAGLDMADTPGGIGVAFSVLSPQSQYDELPPLAVTRAGGTEDAGPGGAAGTRPASEDGDKDMDTPTGEAAPVADADLPRKAEEESGKGSGTPVFLPSRDEVFYPDLPSEVMGILEDTGPAGNERGGSYPFNLHTLVREVHDIVSPLAESKGLIFSWYVAPSLPVLLEGDAPRLRGALILLLQSAVQAAGGGAVQLSVRPNAMSSYEGDLLFSISDNGSAQRTDAGFFLAWELSSRTGGAFTVDYSPASGTRTAFTVRFTVLGRENAADDSAAPGLPLNGPGGGAAAFPQHPAESSSACILLAEMTGGARRHIARCLDDVPHACINAFDEEQLLHLAGEHAPALVIFDADTPETDIIRCIADLRSDEDAKKRTPASILVLTGHDLQSSRLLEAGAGYVLCKPFTRAAFRETLAHAVPALAPLIRDREEVAADRSAGSRKTPPGTAPAASGDSPAVGRDASETAPATPGKSVDHAEAAESDETKLPKPVRLIPRSMPPAAQDAQAFPETAPAGMPETASVIPDKSVESVETAESDEIKFPQPVRLIPRSMTPAAQDAQAFPEMMPAGAAEAALVADGAAPESALAVSKNTPVAGEDASETESAVSGNAPEAAPAASGNASANAPETAPVAPAGSGEPVEAKRPSPVRLIPRGMMPETPAGEAGTPSGIPGKRHLPRDPFLDPSVAFLRPTFTPPSRPPLREAVKLAMSKGQDPSVIVPGAPQISKQIPAQASGPALKSAPQQAPAGARMEAHVQVQARKASPAGVAAAVREPDKEPGPVRPGPFVAAGRPVRARNAALPGRQTVERPGAVQVALPPRHGIPTGRAQQKDAGGPALKNRPARVPGAQHSVQVSVHPSKPGTGPARTGNAVPPHNEDPSPFMDTLSIMGGAAGLSAINRATSDAAPMVMGLSAEDVTAPATTPDRAEARAKPVAPPPAQESPAVSPAQSASATLTVDGKQNSSAEEMFFDLDSIREDAPPGDGKEPDDARQENEKNYAPGSLIDFMLLDSEQGAADGPEPPADGSAPKVPAENPPTAPEVPARNVPAASKVSAQSPPAAPKIPSQNVPPALPVPLAGLDGEFLDPDALPFLPGLAGALGDAVKDAVKGMADNSFALVQEASARMASRAEHFGLNRLGRLARCLERAAEAKDEEASRVILEDLRHTTKRYEDALMECFHGFAAFDR
ncbi:MAG: hypothetical protein LBQ51_08235 [Desulfovibrio sp.]|jgi:CheY-like chemotaxis protein|nr:hypothetical protein [Desulfovibrio sp.]